MNLCKFVGHKSNPEHYGKFLADYEAVDGLKRIHKIILCECIRYMTWFICCHIHLPRKEKAQS